MSDALVGGAAIGLYGYSTRIEPGPLPSSPADYVHPDTPPLLIAHGSQDTFVPPEHARPLVARLRVTSTNPVVYAELPGAQRSFDLFHSIRFETLIDGIQVFTSWIRSPARRDPSGPAVLDKLHGPRIPCGRDRILLYDARPVRLNLGEPGGPDITPWADRVQLIDARPRTAASISLRISSCRSGRASFVITSAGSRRSTSFVRE